MYINYKQHSFIGLSLLCLILCTCTDKHEDSRASSSTLQNLKQRLARIDTVIARNQLSRERLIKKPSKKQLFTYHPKNNSQHIEATYVIWRDKQGTIIVTGTYPFSQSGDWIIANLHYFDDKGRTFAFRRNIRFFSSECTDNVDDIINEDVRTYYDTSFNKIDSTYALTHDQSIVIDPDSCQNPYSYFKYQPSRNLQNYLKRIHYDNTINNTDSTHAH